MKNKIVQNVWVMAITENNWYFTFIELTHAIFIQELGSARMWGENVQVSKATWSTADLLAQAVNTRECNRYWF